MAELLTPRLQRQAAQWLADLQTVRAWHGGLPVLLLERCWLRLSRVPVADLALRLPPNATRAAPELSLYRELLEQGLSPWQAEQQCWREFGSEACHQALRRHWQVLENGDHGWTLERYLALLQDYRDRFARERPRPLPLLVLARAGEDPRLACHQLLWLGQEADGRPRSMRHTCA
jgi:hypothetical protein